MQEEQLAGSLEPGAAAIRSTAMSTRNPYRDDPGATVHVIERVIRRLPGLDLDSGRAEVGRLILAADGFYFVSGWEVHRQRAYASGAFDVALMLLALIPDPFGDAHTSREGEHLLAELRGLDPAEQVERAEGSVHLRRGDIASAPLGRLFGPLRIVESVRGDTYTFEVPRPARKHVRGWLAAHPRP